MGLVVYFGYIGSANLKAQGDLRIYSWDSCNQGPEKLSPNSERRLQRIQWFMDQHTHTVEKFRISRLRKRVGMAKLNELNKLASLYTAKAVCVETYLYIQIYIYCTFLYIQSYTYSTICWNSNLPAKSFFPRGRVKLWTQFGCECSRGQTSISSRLLPHSLYIMHSHRLVQQRTVD